MNESSHPARTYNQIQIPRKYTKGRRRVSVYVTWSYPGETNRVPPNLTTGSPP